MRGPYPQAPILGNRLGRDMGGSCTSHSSVFALSGVIVGKAGEHAYIAQQAAKPSKRKFWERDDHCDHAQGRGTLRSPVKFGASWASEGAMGATAHGGTMRCMVGNERIVTQSGTVNVPRDELAGELTGLLLAVGHIGIATSSPSVAIL
ncbi:hypothetical protein PG990_011240 [Apiospora arundinis]